LWCKGFITASSIHFLRSVKFITIPVTGSIFVIVPVAIWIVAFPKQFQIFFVTRRFAGYYIRYGSSCSWRTKLGKVCWVFKVRGVAESGRDWFCWIRGAQVEWILWFTPRAVSGRPHAPPASWRARQAIARSHPPIPARATRQGPRARCVPAVGRVSSYASTNF
jgi:hypothetical protein